MTAWDELLRQLGLLNTASTAIILAFIGDMVRLLHEQERGGPRFHWRMLPGVALRGSLMGVIATATSLYLHESYGLPELVGAALGGVLGYLGPTVLSVGFKAVLDRFAPKSKGPDDA